MKREYLIYALAVLAGFTAYLILDRGLGIDFGFAMLGGFGVIHLGIVLGRRFL